MPLYLTDNPVILVSRVPLELL